MKLVNQNVVVAGGAGFLGSNLVERLVEQCNRVRGTWHQHAPQVKDERIEWLQTDLMNAEDCHNACSGMDTLIITAAQTAGALVIQNKPLEHLTPNLIMNTRLFEAAYESGIKHVIFISSNTVYPNAPEPMREQDVTGEFYHKYQIVASMKRFSEQIGEMYATSVKTPMDVTVIRPGNMYGPYDDFDWDTSHVLPAFMRRVVERHDPIKVWGKGDDIKDFIYVDDVVDGIVLAMSECKGYNVFNIAGGQGYMLTDLLKIMCEIDGYASPTFDFDISKPTMIPKRLISIAKAENELGFKPKTRIRQGLEKTIEWYKANQ